MIRFETIAATIAGAALLALVPVSFAGEGGAPESDAAKKKPGVVKLEIDEKVDEKPSRDQLATFRIRQKLREAGFVVWTDKPLRIDEMERRKKDKEKAKEAAAPAGPSGTAAVDERPAPDLVIKGKVEVMPSHNSTFFGQNVAYIYQGIGALRIEDASGKSLATVDEHDVWGKTEEKPARDECTKRIAGWLTAAVLKAEPIMGRLGPEAQEQAKRFIAGVEAKRGDKPEGAAPGGGEGEKKK